MLIFILFLSTPKRIKIAKNKEKQMNSICKMHVSKFKIVLSNEADEDRKKARSQAGLRVK